MLRAWKTAVAASIAIVVLPLAAQDAPVLRLTQRYRVQPDANKDAYEVREKQVSWSARTMAVIVCDVWDSHHCLNAVRREEEMVPRMNEVLETLRKKGVLVIHAPSGCMDFYKDHPGRKLAQVGAKATSVPMDIAKWCYKIPSEEKGKYPIDQSDGGEDDDPKEHAEWHAKLKAMGRNPKAPWVRQHEGIKIYDHDAISDSGVEIWDLLARKEINNVILLGVHTNMCVLGRPFGLRQMAKNGKNVVLMRDMTDTMYNPQRWPYVSHFEGTALIVEHIEKFVCPTITSDQIIGGKAFRFKGQGKEI